MARRKRKLSRPYNAGPVNKKSKSTKYLEPTTTATQEEISQLVTLYNIWNLHSKMYAYEKKWYHELVHDQKVLQKAEELIIDSIHRQNWFTVLFMTSVDYATKFYYPRTTTVDAIKIYIRSIIDIIASHSVSPEKQERTDKVCTEGHLFSIFPCKAVKSGDVCIGIKLLDDKLGFAFRIGLRLSEDREFIVPFADYLDPEIEGTNNMNMRELCLVNTSILKLSNLLFDLLDKFERIRQFRNESKLAFQIKFVNKLKKGLHKYTGNVPSMMISVRQSHSECRPSISSHTEESQRVSFVTFDSEFELIEYPRMSDSDSSSEGKVKRSIVSAAKRRRKRGSKY